MGLELPESIITCNQVVKKRDGLLGNGAVDVLANSTKFRRSNSESEDMIRQSSIKLPKYSGYSVQHMTIEFDFQCNQ